MLALIITGFAISAIAPYLYRLLKERFVWFGAAFPLALFATFMLRYPQVASGVPVRERWSWVPSLGLDLSFMLDGLSLTFAMLVTLIGAAVFLYASVYLRHYEEADRFFGFIGMFMTSMLGVVLSDNMLLLFLFWELTSISSFLLIGFNHHQASSRSSALKALLVTGAGGLALLAGMLLLGSVTGSFEISSFYAMNDLITSHRLYPAIVALILVGAFTKSAQFPFHFWLPDAMAAPSPVSAYLHSATMVKAGIYLIARFNHKIGGTALWQDTILVAGAATMIFAGLLSYRQSDLKRLLAYSTVSVLGTLVMLLGIGSKLAIKAFFIYLIAHSLYKGTLFLVAGTLDHETGTRDVSKLGGLWKAMPVTAVTAALASFSMMGVIPLIGFIGKETLYKAVLEVQPWGQALIVLAVAASAFLVVVTLLVGFRPFLGKPRPDFQKVHEAPVAMLVGPLVLALSGLLLGLFPDFFVGHLLEASAVSIISQRLGIEIELWHGFNLVLLLSFVTLLAGVGLYLLRPHILSRMEGLHLPGLVKPSIWYEEALSGMLRFAAWLTSALQNGDLRRYLAVIILSALIPAGLMLFSSGGAGGFSVTLPADLSVTPYEVALAVIIVLATGLLLMSDSRLKAIVSMGVLGFGVGIIFIIYGAPDVALTTFAIETLNVILFVLVLAHLPKFTSRSRATGRLRDGLIAASAGVFMTLTVLQVTSTDLSSRLKEYFGNASLPDGHGRNVVNVILVDFRALDTLGEITVLAIAAIGVFALLKLRTGKTD
ncbi:MAG: putative monovalent cation/H+ antiporter subunit A [Chlorobiaceae bacterium]|nr:putative monovalent cation/H+ antiporter subunit A [Chlorobiaceae bacterium]